MPKVPKKYGVRHDHAPSESTRDAENDVCLLRLQPDEKLFTIPNHGRTLRGCERTRFRLRKAEGIVRKITKRAPTAPSPTGGGVADQMTKRARSKFSDGALRCPKCAAEYEVTLWQRPKATPDYATCQKCHSVMLEWDDSVARSFKLKASPHNQTPALQDI
jgi:Zn ribbon nucleic-acid-binding protein